MPVAEPPYQARRKLSVTADAAWRILTSRPGTRLWLADDLHPGIRIGATIPLYGSSSAEISDICPGKSIKLRFSSGRRATIAFHAVAGKCELSVSDHGVYGRDGAVLRDAWSALLAAADFVVDQTLDNRRSRQAIIVIHGIGSQRPLSTVKSFAHGLIGDAERWSKPDQMSASYELRRYQLPRDRYRPRTDMFELYWADKMPGTKLGQVLSWLRSIMFRQPKMVSAALRPIAYLAWTTVAVAALAVVALVLTIGVDGIGHLWREVTVLAQIAWVGVALSLAGAVVSGLLTAYLGDAARYLDAAPDNIAVRQLVRQNGVALLRRLHEEGGYDRIVIVGHSLGSVIGYDIVRLYWSEVNRSHGQPGTVRQPTLDSYRKLLAAASPADVDKYRQAQRELWCEYRRHGQPWLVTDLVTVGSPLTHAGTLLARSPSDLEALMNGLELSTCPPRLDPGHLAQRERYLVDGQIRTILMLTHSAPFAVTRWTNIYAPARGIIFGDAIGGPLAPVFGSGIQDIPVYISSRWRRRTPLAHTSYWRNPADTDPRAPIPALLRSIGLESGRWLDKHVSDMPWEMSIRETSRQP
jgi:hypothetical protein